jgi:hypothetical protein
MRWTKIMLAAALTLGAVPAMASGAERATKQERQQEWLRDRARLSRGLDNQIERKSGDEGDSSLLVDAGDLDGDGRSDFVDLRSHLTYDQSLGVQETMRLEAFRGYDGKALWTRSLAPSAFVFPLIAKVGIDGKPGVVVLTFDGFSDYSQAGGADEFHGTVQAYDHAGAPAWAHPLPGADGFSIPGYVAVYGGVHGFFDVTNTGATDVLISTGYVAEANDPTWTVYESRSLTQFAVIDGATGTVTPLGMPVPGDWSGVWGYPVGDLDKDKRDDVVLDHMTESGPVLTAISGATGLTLWTQPATGDFGFREIVALPDVTGDGAADVGILNESFGDMTAATAAAKPIPVPMASSTATLVDGAKGTVRWSKPGTRMFALGNADKKAGSEVAVGDYVYTSASYGFTVAAYTASGKRLWSVRRTVPSGRNEYGKNSWGAIGDVHGDGVTDVGFAVVSGSGRKAHREEGTVNGRTGRVSRDQVPGLWATRAALDAHGADAYETKSARGVFTVTAWPGNGGSRLWSTSVRSGETFYRSFATSVDGDKCGDMVTSLYGAHDVDVVFSGSAGTPLWMLTRTGTAAGVASKPSVTAHKVYRKSC